MKTVLDRLLVTKAELLAETVQVLLTPLRHRVLYSNIYIVGL
jgi:hypothetical protein